MKFLVHFLCLLTVTSGITISQSDLKEWSKYKLQHGKSYSSLEEDHKRLVTFLDNKQKVEAHNEQFEKGKETYTMALNKFSDLTFEEFSAQYLIQEPSVIQKETKTGRRRTSNKDNSKLPVSYDWRDLGYVTPVKDQGKCQSAFTFAAVGGVESAHAIITTKLVSLSEQQVLDCAQGTGQCGPKNMKEATEYIMNNHILDTESSYPYNGTIGQCQYDPANHGARILYYFIDDYLPEEIILTNSIYLNGPNAVSIEVTPSFIHYDKGVYYGTNCTNDGTNLNHGALAVGYGNDNGTNFYSVKNSWGGDWGEGGYIRMSRNGSNNCDIATLFANVMD